MLQKFWMTEHMISSCFCSLWSINEFTASPKKVINHLSYVYEFYCLYLLQSRRCLQTTSPTEKQPRCLQTQESSICFFFFSDLMSNEQECYTIKSPSCKEYELPNALLIYGNSTRITYPNLILIHWVCQSKHHTIAKDGTQTDHTINQDVESNDLFTKNINDKN